MYLDEIVRAQKRGEAKGIASICSAHPWVLKTAMQATAGILLIEATCNQVNQFGGYTGMKPEDFVRYVRRIAQENHFPFENILLGGDHLGPSVWQAEFADSAMQKSMEMVKGYVQAGFVKIHLDCSMRLNGDRPGALDVEISAKRAAQLAKVAEAAYGDAIPLPRYIIGTEVPIPGGAHDHEGAVRVSKVEDTRQTLEVTRDAFYREGLQSAWERVIGVVVQPGVEFGDAFILQYQPEKAEELSRFIERQSMIYEAHSTDYQTEQALRSLVRDHFAILKVGPALTFAFREAVFALALIENELFALDERSNLIQILDDVMMRQPEYWNKYYRGPEAEQAFKRKYSYSDRVRYYWADPGVQAAFDKLMGNLGGKPLPNSLLEQFAGEAKDLNAREVIESKIRLVLKNYQHATDLGD
jgi:D-tagatose-1,6-bisphosphate aldolase subunit GatZ/KbaZ